MLKKFNINDGIKVKLNESGYKHYLDWFNEVRPNHMLMETLKDWADKEGYMNFQLWHFIEVFGGVTHLGMMPYFETDILIDVTN